MIDALERRSHFIIPTLLGLVVIPLALTLMIVGARSPYTHANLALSYDSSYTRTDQALVGSSSTFQPMMPAITMSNEPVERGRELFVLDECASCHGLDGRGGAVGPSVAGKTPDLVRKATQKGMGGMPAFDPAVLGDEDLQAIAAYLKAMDNGEAALAAPNIAAMRAKPEADSSTSPARQPVGASSDAFKTRPSLAAGQKVYAADCASCHGDKGDGKGPAASGLSPAPANLADLKTARSASPASWHDSVLTGHSKGGTPDWQGSLSESDVWNVVMYARTLAAPADKIAAGKATYTQNCSICHGDEGKGDGPFAGDSKPAPANFTDAATLINQSNQSLFDIVTKGKGTMPDFHTDLTDDQRWNVVDYLWTFLYGP